MVEEAGMLTGGELLSQEERVAIIAGAIGRRPEIQELTEIEAREAFGGGAAPDSSRGAEVDAVLALIRDAAAGGSPATGVVREVLGREPLPYRQWVADHQDDFS